MPAKRYGPLRLVLATTLIVGVAIIGPSETSALLRAPGVSPAGEPAATALSGYRVRVEAKPVTQIEANLSGLAYDRGRGHLWAVVNEPEELLALSVDGELLARHPLSGFEDVEGVAVLGDGRLVVAEERRGALVILPAPQRPGTLHRDHYGALKLPLQGPANGGFEGLGYDAASDRLFVVKEHSPQGLYEIRGLGSAGAGPLDVEIVDRSDWLPGWPAASDVSSVEFDAGANRLLLLSEKSRSIVELDSAGRRSATHPLTAAFAGLSAAVPQAEGLALDDRGGLYVVSEPNLFYAFAPAQSGSAAPAAR